MDACREANPLRFVWLTEDVLQGFWRCALSRPRLHRQLKSRRSQREPLLWEARFLERDYATSRFFLQASVWPIGRKVSVLMCPHQRPWCCCGLWPIALSVMELAAEKKAEAEIPPCCVWRSIRNLRAWSAKPLHSQTHPAALFQRLARALCHRFSSSQAVMASILLCARAGEHLHLGSVPNRTREHSRRIQTAISIFVQPCQKPRQSRYSHMWSVQRNDAVFGVLSNCQTTSRCPNPIGARAVQQPFRQNVDPRVTTTTALWACKTVDF